MGIVAVAVVAAAVVVVVAAVAAARRLFVFETVSVSWRRSCRCPRPVCRTGRSRQVSISSALGRVPAAYVLSAHALHSRGPSRAARGEEACTTSHPALV